MPELGGRPQDAGTKGRFGEERATAQPGLGFRVQGLGFWVSGLGFRV